jgi:hypothetical protein
MFNHCRYLKVSLNIKKCISFVPFWNLLGHIVCRGVLVDPEKVVVTMNMPPPMIAKQFWSTLGHTRYYYIFNRNYASITAPVEKLLKKYESFSWKIECDQDFNILK